MNSKIILTLVFCGSLVPTSPLVHAARWGGGVLSVGAAYHAAATLSDERDEIEDELSMLEARRDKMPEGSSRFLVDRRIRAKQRELNRITKKIQIFYVAALASGAISAAGWMQGGSEESGEEPDTSLGGLFGGRSRDWIDVPSDKRVQTDSFNKYAHQVDVYSKSPHGEEFLPSVRRGASFIKIINVAGDGHCGYRSVSRGLVLAKKVLPKVDGSTILTTNYCVGGKGKYFEGTLKDHLLEKFESRVEALKDKYKDQKTERAIRDPVCNRTLTELQLLADSGGVQSQGEDRDLFGDYVDSLKLKERFKIGVKGSSGRPGKWADNTILQFFADSHNMPLVFWQPAQDNAELLVVRSIHFPERWIVGEKVIKKNGPERVLGRGVVAHARYEITPDLCTSQGMVHIVWTGKNHFQSVEVTKL